MNSKTLLELLLQNNTSFRSVYILHFYGSTFFYCVWSQLLPIQEKHLQHKVENFKLSILSYIKSLLNCLANNLRFQRTALYTQKLHSSLSELYFYLADLITDVFGFDSGLCNFACIMIYMRDNGIILTAFIEHK